MAALKFNARMNLLGINLGTGPGRPECRYTTVYSYNHAACSSMFDKLLYTDV